jgi:hypothetical protein
MCTDKLKVIFRKIVIITAVIGNIIALGNISAAEGRNFDEFKRDFERKFPGSQVTPIGKNGANLDYYQPKPPIQWTETRQNWYEPKPPNNSYNPSSNPTNETCEIQ